MPATTAETLSLVTRTVSVAPLVLLSAADHYGRQPKAAKGGRAVGVLLGQNDGKSVRVSNSYAGLRMSSRQCSRILINSHTVPFEEDEKNPAVWFLDHNYVEGMNDMFKKVNAREKLIGWYHTGPKLRASDLEINELFKRYTPNPLLVIIDVQPKEVGVPTDAYFAVEEIKDVSPERTPSHNSCLSFAGWHHHQQDFRPHSIGDRSRRGRRNRGRAPPTRHPRRGSRHTIYTHNISAPIPPRPASAIKRYRSVFTKGARREAPSQPCYHGQPARRF